MEYIEKRVINMIFSSSFSISMRENVLAANVEGLSSIRIDFSLCMLKTPDLIRRKTFDFILRSGGHARIKSGIAP